MFVCVHASIHNYEKWSWLVLGHIPARHTGFQCRTANMGIISDDVSVMINLLNMWITTTKLHLITGWNCSHERACNYSSLNMSMKYLIVAQKRSGDETPSTRCVALTWILSALLKVTLRWTIPTALCMCKPCAVREETCFCLTYFRTARHTNKVCKAAINSPALSDRAESARYGFVLVIWWAIWNLPLSWLDCEASVFSSWNVALSWRCKVAFDLYTELCMDWLDKHLAYL